MNMSKYAKQLKAQLETGHYPISEGYPRYYLPGEAGHLIFEQIGLMLDEEDPLFVKEISLRLASAFELEKGFPVAEQRLRQYLNTEEKIREEYKINKRRLDIVLKEFYRLKRGEKIELSFDPSTFNPGSKKTQFLLFKSKDKLLERIKAGSNLEKVAKIQINF